MDLIERYLQAVKGALPEAQRDDIIKELRDNLLSQVEEREGVLGRSLSEDEVADLLKALGRPRRLAAKYGPARQLIGPTMFPVYLKVMKTALGLVFLVHIGISIATAAAGRSFGESLGMLFRYPGAALMTFAWITLVFAGLEYFGTKLRVADPWDPRSLPALVQETTKRRSRVELITELALQSVFGIWWLVGLRQSWMILGPFLRFAPIWQTTYPLFVFMLLANVGLTMGMLMRPDWTRGRDLTRLVMSALGLVVLYFLINAPELFLAADGRPLPVPGIGEQINRGVHIGLVIAALINAIKVIRYGAQLAGKRLGRIMRTAA